jgi:hypothetical protein
LRQPERPSLASKPRTPLAPEPATLTSGPCADALLAPTVRSRADRSRVRCGRPERRCRRGSVWRESTA